jgi:ornithine cyclodeaminase
LFTLGRLESVARDAGLAFEAVDLDRLGAESDVIITTTSSFQPILKASQVARGTHLACMGTDTRGKQELDTDILAGAKVFTDDVAQSASIGEAQHAVGQGLLSQGNIVEFGFVIVGHHPGRQSADEITVFDGTGVGLQDLADASAAVDAAIAKGVAIDIDF